MKSIFAFLLMCAWMLPVGAAIEAYQFEDAETEQTYKDLIAELRCLVCQNQNLADSDADLAKDLRQQTYEMLQQGKDRAQIVDYMVNRYGDFVLYRPPVKSSTYLLWIGPFALLLIVLVLVILRVRKPEPLAPPEQDAMERARSLLDDQDNDGNKS